MGINLALILSHSMDAAGVAAFPARVQSSVLMRRAAERLWHVMRPRWSHLDAIDEFSTVLATEHLSASAVITAWDRKEDVPSFLWAGFHLYFGERAVAAIHLEKLAGFVLDLDELRSPLRGCAEALAVELRSSAIVYGPDSVSPFEEALWVEKGGSFEELIATARHRCGEPARDVRDMADDEQQLNLETKCYYVEALHLVEP
jgi:hypothetical protein